MHDNGSELVKRLMDCGFSESNALDLCMRYAANNQWDELEKYIHTNELLYDDRKQYPSER